MLHVSCCTFVLLLEKESQILFEVKWMDQGYHARERERWSWKLGPFRLRLAPWRDSPWNARTSELVCMRLFLGQEGGLSWQGKAHKQASKQTNTHTHTYT